MQPFQESSPHILIPNNISFMNYINRTSLLVSIFGLATAFAQQPLSPSNPSAPDLKQMEQRFYKNFELNRIKADSISKITQTPLKQKFANGQMAAFYGFSANGQMLFYQTENIGAARTLSTSKVWPGGIAGTALTGSGMTNRLGEWDGGAVLTTHQEFGGRVIQVDGSTDLSDHATHVAGTLVAAGVDADAKGMAYQAPLKAYDWDFDQGEMAAAAGAGMLVSNHSYGTICGWRYNSNQGSSEWWGDVSISQTEDYKFGFYDQQASEWDDIAFSYPFYLICKSAGNDRGNNIFNGPTHLVRDENWNWVSSNTVRPADGGTLGYDCITPSAVSKNILTVGAVEKINNSNTNNGYVNASGVVMSSFSGWGPTDDGRIKPDVVGAGVDIYSTGPGSNTDYLGGFSGTSMASPNVAGSLLLVQQHYNNRKGSFMRAATLKALAIHTADEAGSSEGPDYKFGWGLINTAKAVKLITDSNYNQILERSLANGGSYTQGITSDGSTPLKVTICWTDRAGTPTIESLDPTTLMLVNDLDIRLKRVSDNTIFFPYILNPANPAAAATKADNFRDNVEQVYIAAPAAGAYTITITHKGTLFANAAQNFSLIIGGIVGKPAAAFSVNNKSVCTGQAVTYTDNSGGNPSSRVWYFPGGTPATSSAATVNVTYATPGTYAAALKVTNALGSDSLYTSNIVGVGGLILPFNETFESNSPTLTSWVIGNPDFDSTWRLATIGGTSPGNTAYCAPFYNNNNYGSRDQLTSPTLSFKGFQNVSLSFKHAYTNYYPTETDSLIVYISTNCGTTWTRLKSLGEDGTSNFNTVPTDNSGAFSPNNASQWCISNCNILNLTAYDGMENIKIRFESFNYYNNNLYLDNINITGTALKPIAKFGALQTTVCVGNPLQFKDSTDNNPTSWQWTFTGAVSENSATQHPIVTYNTPGTYAVKLIATNGGGSDSLTKTGYITVLPSPNIPNITSNRTAKCIGDSILLTTDSVANGFQWLLNNSLINGAANNSIHALVGGTYNVRLMGNNGCGRNSAPLSITESAVPAQPNITSNLTSTSLCQGGTATLTSSSNAGNQWYKNGNSLSGAVNKTFQTQDSGSYTVIATNGGCPSMASNPLTLTLRTKPVTSVISGEANPTVNSVQVYTVTPTPGSSYTWTITNGTPATSTNTTGSIQVTWANQSTGKVAVRETGANGCSGDIKNLNITLSPNTGLTAENWMNTVSVYPNPVNSQLTISFAQTLVQTATIRVVNILGQTIQTELIQSPSAGTLHTIDMNRLNPGLYIIEIEQPSGTKQVRVMKR